MELRDFLFVLLAFCVLFAVIFYAVKFAILEAHREIKEQKTEPDETLVKHKD